MSRRVPVLLICALTALGGCASVGSAAISYFDGCSEVMAENPVSVGPFIAGVIIFGIAGLPFEIISYPATLLFYPEDESTEYEVGSAWAPPIFLGTTGGVLLGAIFYPFGLPWVPDDQPPAWPGEITYGPVSAP